MYENAGPVWSPTPAGPPSTVDPRYAGPPRPPSGLLPTGPARPTYREPHPIRGAALATGISGAAAWLLLFGLLGRDVPGYAWWTIISGGVAWLVALLLVRHGDRGVAAGIAITTALGWAIAATAVATRWATTADWPLW